MIVEWTKTGLKTIPLMNKKGREEKTIFLQPGFNDILDKEWNMARRNQMILDQIEAGVIKEVGEKEEIEVEKIIEDEYGEAEKKKVKVKKAKSTSIAELAPEEALKIIEDTASVSTLEAWRKVESRDEIRAAISNKLQEIEDYGKKKGK